ncbi:MAG: class I SAM-dependent methyltransferase [Gammaproteobacteria bacterium]
MTFPTIVCPVDLLPVTEQQEGWLVCSNQHRYQKRDGIPRLVSSQVTYADAFGEQWKRYRTTQLDSYSKTSISKARLRGCLGDDLWSALQQPGRTEILEAGCGAGRFTEVLLQLPTASVTSTDLSAAVEPNQINCPQSDRHRVIQCDINAFPFAPSQFDLVLCIGVVQHTRDPERTIADLYRQVRPGGSLVIDHYAPNLSRYTKISSLLLRPILKRVSPAKGMAVTEWLTKVFFPLHRMVRNHRLLQVLLSRVSPLATYFQTIPELGDQQQYEWAVLDTHDGLTDYYQHLRSARDIESTLSRLGAVRIVVAEGGNGIEARCVKPN